MVLISLSLQVMTASEDTNKASLFVPITQWALLLLAFMLPLPGRIPLPAIWLTSLLVLAEVASFSMRSFSLRFIRERFAAQGKGLAKISFFLLVAFYIIGSFYSDDLQQALFELEKKTMLLVFPLIIMMMHPEILRGPMLKKVLIGFLSGLFSLTLYDVGAALLRYLQSSNPAEFYYSLLAGAQHPSYLSLYACFALGASVWLVFSPEGVHNRLGKGLLVASVPWWILIITLLSSKAGMLSLALTLAFISAQVIRQSHKRARWVLILMLLLMIPTGLMFSGSIRARFSVMKNISLEPSEISHAKKADGVVIRKLSWEIAWNQWLKSPLLGTGTGDYRKQTYHELEKRNLLTTFEGFKNTHNQFLQTAATLGTFGFFALLMWLFVPLLSLRRSKRWLYTLLILLVSANLLVESMLEVQSGVLFISFFHVFLYAVKGEEKKPATVTGPATD